MSRWAWLWRLLSRRLWFRAAAFSVAAILLALLAAWIAPLIPYELGGQIGAKAVDGLLQIIAASMLAVTTFSLAAMVSAYASATSSLTPRAVTLLLEDTTSQNALSTFIGGFLFAIVGICALSTGLYGDQGRVILFFGTIAVILVIVLTLLRWIEHVAYLGRVDDTIARIERAATAACGRVAHTPRPEATAAPPIPQGARAVFGDTIGYVTHIDFKQLARCSEERQTLIHLAVLPGSLVQPKCPLAWVVGETDGDVAQAFTVADARSYDHDPRFALVVLSEIASRALSPAVNDPGTAIAVMGAQLRVIATLMTGPRDDAAKPNRRVIVPAIACEDIVIDAFRPIARDGAGMVEVGVKLQKTFAILAALIPALAPAIRRAADEARTRADTALTLDADRRGVAHAHALIEYG